MDTWIREIEEELRSCGEILLHADRSQLRVDEKDGRANFVTTYDRMIQERLAEALPRILPGATFVGEEEDIHASIAEGYAFIVDPIDGTTNFIHDYHMSCISVGVIKGGQPYAGVVYNPYLDEMYTAEVGCGAFLNGQPMHVSDLPLSKGIVLMGTAPYYTELHDETFRLAREYFEKSMDIRRSASAALDLCMIAAGRAELFFELRLQPWDYAAGCVLVQEAGGVITTMDGTPIRLDQPCSILAHNGKNEL